MLKSICVTLFVLAFTAQAQAEELLGRWPAALIKPGGMSGYFNANEFYFRILRPELSGFLDCAIKVYPDRAVFLEGTVEAEYETGNVSSAYLCTVDTRSDSCPASARKVTCP